MELVSSNTDEEIRQNEAKEAIVWPLRDLAANMLRVVRGAGKAHELNRQMVRVIQSFETYREVVGMCPSTWEIERALNIHEELGPGYPEREHIWEECRNQAIRGALQIAASRLLGQMTQESRGKSELMDGFIGIEEIRAANLKERQASERAERPPRKMASRKTRKPRTKP